MKTRITIEIDTDLDKIYAKLEDGELDKDNEVTPEFEKQLHEAIDNEIRNFIEEKLEEYVMEDTEFDWSVEGYDSFKDYGKVEIKINTEEIHQILEALK